MSGSGVRLTRLPTSRGMKAGRISVEVESVSLVEAWPGRSARDATEDRELDRLGVNARTVDRNNAANWLFFNTFL